MWVRAGDDVLLVARPMRGPGEILAVVRARFAPAEGAATRFEAQDPTDYALPPSAYRLDVAKSLLFPPLAAGVVMLFFLLLWKYLPDEKAKPPAQ